MRGMCVIKAVRKNIGGKWNDPPSLVSRFNVPPLTSTPHHLPMPKLAVDVDRLRALTLVATSGIGIDRRFDCPFDQLVDLHRTRRDADFLTNAVSYKGAPLVYTCTNPVDGFFGARARLVYVPSHPFATGVVQGGVLAGGVASGVVAGPSVLGSFYHLVLRPVVEQTGVAALLAAIGVGGYLVPYDRLLSKYKDVVPFSSYVPVTDDFQTGRWHVLQHRSTVVTVVVVVPLPVDRVNQAVREYCVVRLRSAKLSMRARYAGTFAPETVDVVVVSMSDALLRATLAEWKTLTGELARAADDHSTAMWPAAAKVQTLVAYNAAHDAERFRETLAPHLSNLTVPLLALDPAEKRALHRTGGYCAVRRVDEVPLAAHVLENVVYQWASLRAYDVHHYVHCTSLHARGVHHVLAFAFDPLHAMSVADRTKALAFVDQATEHRTLVYRHQRDTLTVPTGHQRYLFLYLSSDRVNNAVDGLVQLHQLHAMRMYTTTLPTTIGLNDVREELANTAVGGEGFELRPTCAWDARLYEHTVVNDVQTRLYEKTKARVAHAERRLQAVKTVNAAEQHLVAHDIARVNRRTARRQADTRRRRGENGLRRLKRTAVRWKAG